MSIVPYNPNNQILYHDPANRIVIVHNNQENTIRLLNPIASSEDEGVVIKLMSGKKEPPELFCPSCGAPLDYDQASLRGSEYTRRRRSSASHGSGRGPSTGNVLSQSSTNRVNSFSLPHVPETPDIPPRFLHHDYFKLLANLPYNGSASAIAPPGELETAPGDLFNQGYFERFFRMVPPGVLGSGAHAQVYKVMHVLKNIQLGIFAVKRINVGDLAHYLDQVLNEVLILYELSVTGANENNLIRYNHVWMEMGDLLDLGTFFLSKDGTSPDLLKKTPFVYILQQYCDGGHLENLISKNFQWEANLTAHERLERERERRRNKKHESAPTKQTNPWLSDFEIWKFSRDIANGVTYLHSHGILHRDLKPSNCLLESKYVQSETMQASFDSVEDLEKAALALPKILVSDFGEGKFIDKLLQIENYVQFDQERRGNTGTLEFTDPKLWIYDAPIKGATQNAKAFAYSFTRESDIYSLGMIFCYLCVGSLPFKDLLTDLLDPEKIRIDIEKWHRKLTPESFHTWFVQQVQSVKGDMSGALTDFESLIFMMIKGQEGVPTPSSKEVMEGLEAMKWTRFVGLQKERRQSEATITEMPRNKANKFAPEEETLDLTKVPSNSLDLTQAPYSGGIVPRTFTHDHLHLLPVAGVLLNLSILEMLDPLGSFKIVKLAKYSNILGLAIVPTVSMRTRFYLAACCVILTLLACYRTLMTSLDLDPILSGPR